MNHKIRSLIEYFHQIHFDSVFDHFLVLKKRKNFDVFRFKKSSYFFFFSFGKFIQLVILVKFEVFGKKSKKEKIEGKTKKFEENVFFKAFFPKNVLFEKHF